MRFVIAWTSLSGCAAWRLQLFPGRQLYPSRERHYVSSDVKTFIAMKVFAGGPQDLADAAAAFAAAPESLDMPLMRRLVTRYGRDASIALERLLAGSRA